MMMRMKAPLGLWCDTLMDESFDRFISDLERVPLGDRRVAYVACELACFGGVTSGWIQALLCKALHVMWVRRCEPRVSRSHKSSAF